MTGEKARSWHVAWKSETLDRADCGVDGDSPGNSVSNTVGQVQYHNGHPAVWLGGAGYGALLCARRTSIPQQEIGRHTADNCCTIECHKLADAPFIHTNPGYPLNWSFIVEACRSLISI